MDDLLREAIATYQNAAAEFGDRDAVAQAAAALDGDKGALKEISPALKIRVAADIPADRAWKTGRRVYVRSAKGSALSEALWGANATWDREHGAHYIGTGKLEALLPLIREAGGRAARVQDVKAAGLWIAIPIGAKDVREHAKGLGAVWDADRKEWALPTAEAREEVAAKVTTWQASKPKRAASSAPAQRRSSRKCDECGKRAGKHERRDSSGIAGLVCDICDREPSYALSFA